ncbi:MAG: ferredoxin, partial [Sphaerochaetaceae bacterium]|nr:ferredoxin [Sphaerochaetaceae bacterium]
QWPVQINLVPVKADFFNQADLLVSADCAAYAYGDFHKDFIKGRITLIGCPKLDDVDYSEKLAMIIQANDIRSITVARMEVPCCGGLENAARRAVQKSGRLLDLQVLTISAEGRIVNRD